MEKLRAVQTTTFEHVPIGNEFLLGSPETEYSRCVFKKVSSKFAVCEDYKGSNYYFYPEEKVVIAHNGN